MLTMKPVDHEPESFANVLNVCRFCVRNAETALFGPMGPFGPSIIYRSLVLSKSRFIEVSFLFYRSLVLSKSWGSQRRPTLASISRHHSVLVKRGAEISQLQKRRKYHDRYYRLRKCCALSAGNRCKTGCAENNDRGQNDKSESNSEHRPDQRAANGQRNHATVLHKMIGNRNSRRLKMT
jgi:hypothetical protein